MQEAVRNAFGVLPTWAQVLTLLVAALVGAKLIELVGYYVLNQVERLAKSGYDRLIIEETHMPLYVSIFLGGIYLSARFVPQVSVSTFVATVALSMIILLWARTVVRLGRRIITLTNDSPTERQIAPAFKNLLTSFVVLATLVTLLVVWNIDATPLLASAGILGIIVGVAARDSLRNFFGGLSLHFDNAYHLGDMVLLESGERGIVTDMSIRSTTLLTRDNTEVTVPNAQMNSTQVINESAPVSRRRIRLNIGVAYDSDLEAAEEAIIDAAHEEQTVLDAPVPKVRFLEFDDSAIVAQLQCHIARPSQRDEARHGLVRHIDTRFDDADIKIPFPQREVTFFESGNEISITDNEDDCRSEAFDEPDRENREFSS